MDRAGLRPGADDAPRLRVPAARRVCPGGGELLHQLHSSRAVPLQTLPGGGIQGQGTHSQNMALCNQTL